MVELAWLWLQNQPTSALSLWFHERVRRLGGRMRKTTIVALARKLLIALWRYTAAGVVIEGAMMKAVPAVRVMTQRGMKALREIVTIDWPVLVLVRVSAMAKD